MVSHSAGDFDVLSRRLLFLEDCEEEDDEGEESEARK
jgi:hypothetical protein